MNIKYINKLNNELLKIINKNFFNYMNIKLKNTNKTHLLKINKKKIAKIKYFLSKYNK